MASIRKSHYVLLPREDGSVAMHSMKEWLRQNPEHIPESLDATGSTSQQLRAALKKQGWTLQETETEFRLLPPGAAEESSSTLREMLNEPEVSEQSEDGERDTSFGLESQLRDFLAQNLSSIPINGQRLKIYVDPTGRDGIEYPTAVGFIDLLAVDEAGTFYILELKRGRTPDYTVGQLARYMGWVSQTIGKGKGVRGVIVAKSISDSMRYAVCVFSNVSLFEYEVSFKLHAATPMQVAS